MDKIKTAVIRLAKLMAGKPAWFRNYARTELTVKSCTLNMGEYYDEVHLIATVRIYPKHVTVCYKVADSRGYGIGCKLSFEGAKKIFIYTVKNGWDKSMPKFTSFAYNRNPQRQLHKGVNHGH